MVRKSIDDDPNHHLIYCTHCTRAPWRVSVDFTTTSAQLRHLRAHHPSLPTTQEGENSRIQELSSASPGTITRSIPSSSEAAQISSAHSAKLEGPTQATPAASRDINPEPLTAANQQSVWSKEEVERLIGWMERNLEDARGKQVAWHKSVKDEVFGNDKHITVKMISDKLTDLKNQWMAAKAMLSNWGFEDDDEQSTLERRPNAMRSAHVDSSARSTTSSPPPQSSRCSSISLGEVDDMEEDIFISASQSSAQRSSTRLSTQPPTRRSAARQSSSSHPLSRREKRSIIGAIKELMDESHAAKRLKMEHDVEIQRLKSKERIVQIQTDAQVKKFEVAAKMMQEVILGLCAPLSPPHNKTSRPVRNENPPPAPSPGVQ